MARSDTDRVNAYRSRLLTEAKLSRRTAQKLMTLLSGVFKRSLFLGWIPLNPMAGVEPVKMRPPVEFNYLDVSEVEAIR